ncbi:undecaprenyldiphospho-muramoylpentapeptide beta-N-acetylglucosaminyltransferase [Paenisporosarcina cavernae]|uniref:UDP-N-acetylglucosamine--N-acetylmuramyl-(pentapeptide) pyrophosphoryl-undecaprenol N-acetylglucosamine transferase n=1 Tax=Paenisporosarcina cavernae TaxID=2320858 RepID=A0A385YRQ2_9BACL|nr:undecaprenyldiphospho-muramoylpentapeptide beta-N-acetylglucosaminyltransferase [Paenisporosarcina cavernae]AYC29455.1 undecaprenyldiphospho-muramoylpentapeptide beta-N-acetylglucosaminyltransferase [Paenisporosarcina cavernae]
MKKKIALTGGGTAGHVSLNQAIIPSLIENNYEVMYIGSRDGIEKELISENFPTLPYASISSGKLRRYFSLENISDSFRVVKGVFDSIQILIKNKPDVIFSKGGFVSVPVAIAAKLLRIPLLIHESDVTPGLANKIAMPFAKHIFTVFHETLEYVDQSKATCSGAVIREELLVGNRLNALKKVGFSGNKAVLFVMGGSQGSDVLNGAIRSNLSILQNTYDIIHLCGKDKVSKEHQFIDGYVQIEYVSEGLNDLLHLADVVVSRAGSNSIYEFLALRIPMLLIPLSAQKSRGDQVLNAQLFEKQGFALVLQEEELSPEAFLEKVQQLEERKSHMRQVMEQSEMPKTPRQMVELIEKYQ